MKNMKDHCKDYICVSHNIQNVSSFLSQITQFILDSDKQVSNIREFCTERGIQEEQRLVVAHYHSDHAATYCADLKCYILFDRRVECRTYILYRKTVL